MSLFRDLGRLKAKVYDERTGRNQRAWLLLRIAIYNEFRRQSKELNLLERRFRFAIQGVM